MQWTESFPREKESVPESRPAGDSPIVTADADEEDLDDFDEDDFDDDFDDDFEEELEDEYDIEDDFGDNPDSDGDFDSESEDEEEMPDGEIPEEEINK